MINLCGSRTPSLAVDWGGEEGNGQARQEFFLSFKFYPMIANATALVPLASAEEWGQD